MSTAPLDTLHLFTVLRRIEVVILSTTTMDGRLVSRPMLLQQVDPDCTLWFFINRNSSLAGDLRRHQQVAVAHVSTVDESYLAISGKGWLIDEPELVTRWWRPEALAWFPLGVADPEIGLLRVDAYSAHRWGHGDQQQISLQG